jgi:hypothetical protein
VLLLRFNEDELLSVTAPKGIQISASVFKISDASRVRWEWFSYGQPKTAANLKNMEFKKLGTNVSGVSSGGGWNSILRPLLDSPAVEIVRPPLSASLLRV